MLRLRACVAWHVLAMLARPAMLAQGGNEPVAARAGIGTEEVTGVRETQQEYVHWEKRYRGLCRHEYYVGKPAQRTVAEPFRETTYKLDPDRIKARQPLMAAPRLLSARVHVLTTMCATFIGYTWVV